MVYIFLEVHNYMTNFDWLVIVLSKQLLYNVIQIFTKSLSKTRAFIPIK